LPIDIAKFKIPIKPEQMLDAIAFSCLILAKAPQ